MGNFRCPVVVGSRFFQKTFNKDNVPGLGRKLLQKPLFSVEAHHRQAKRHCLVPGKQSGTCFDFRSRTISTINLRAVVIPESSVSGKEAASRMLPLSTHFSPGVGACRRAPCSMTQNVGEVRTNRGNFVNLCMRALPNLTVVHNFVADLAG